MVSKRWEWFCSFILPFIFFLRKQAKRSFWPLCIPFRSPPNSGPRVSSAQDYWGCAGMMPCQKGEVVKFSEGKGWDGSNFSAPETESESYVGQVAEDATPLHWRVRCKANHNPPERAKSWKKELTSVCMCFWRKFVKWCNFSCSGCGFLSVGLESFLFHSFRPSPQNFLSLEFVWIGISIRGT